MSAGVKKESEQIEIPVTPSHSGYLVIVYYRHLMEAVNVASILGVIPIKRTVDVYLENKSVSSRERCSQQIP